MESVHADFSEDAWDVIGEVNFSRSFDLLKGCPDALGLIKANQDVVEYLATVCDTAH